MIQTDTMDTVLIQKIFIFLCTFYRKYGIIVNLYKLSWIIDTIDTILIQFDTELLCISSSDYGIMLLQNGWGINLIHYIHRERNEKR